MRRIITAREQYEMLSPWLRMASSTVTVGSMHGSQVVHLATEPQEGRSGPMHFRACGVNPGNYGNQALDSRSVREALPEEVSCRSCRKRAREAAVSEHLDLIP